MRASEDFENIAMDIYQLFDDVINNLENVDAALNDIRRAAMSFPLNKHMIKVNDNLIDYDACPNHRTYNFRALCYIIWK